MTEEVPRNIFDAKRFYRENRRIFKRIFTIVFAVFSATIFLFVFIYILLNTLPTHPEMDEKSQNPLGEIYDIPENNMHASAKDSAKFETGEYGYMIITNQEGFEKFDNYRERLFRNPRIAGISLQDKLQNNNIGDMTTEDLINLMLSTKEPMVFAERYTPNSPSWPWTVEEVELLGDVNVAMPVKIFDHGEWYNPTIHQIPINGYLMFTPGVLLHDHCQIDYQHIINNNGRIRDDMYYETYERRLLPLLTFANEEAGAKGTKAVVTIPAVGCGAFAGSFSDGLSCRFGNVLKEMLHTHGSKLQNISFLLQSTFQII